MHALIEQAAGGYGDLAEQAGSITGSTGTKKGDEVVTLNPDDTRGASVAYVFEIKDRKLPLRKTLEELDAAIANREAGAGIAVFSSQGRAPTSLPFTPFGTKALLVVDKDDPDPNVVRLACMWARWIVCRELTLADSGDADLDRIAAQIDAARRALGRISTIRRAHSAARNSLNNAGSEVESLSEELNLILDDIEHELRRR